MVRPSTDSILQRLRAIKLGRSGDRVVIDEIKSTHKELDAFEHNPDPLHWGQVQAYAWLYATYHDLDAVDAQLTYYQLTTKETREFRRTYTLDELNRLMTALLDDYVAWATRLEHWRLQRDRSIRGLGFPFGDFREGQRRMAVTVYRSIQTDGRAMIQAPTGIGKTMAALFPALKALGEGLTAKLFYLTARTTGRQAAEKALSVMRRRGLQLKSLTLTAKDKLCPYPDATCTPEECPRARGHFDRMKGARLAARAWSRAEAAMARATARSSAGSPTVRPPARLAYTSRPPTSIPPRRARTAMSRARRLASSPATVRRGGP